MPSQADIITSLGARIRMIRKERRVTLKELAEETGLSIGFLSRLERGQISSSVVSLIQIAKALSIVVADLFDSPLTPLRAPIPDIEHGLCDHDRACDGYRWRLLAGGMPDDDGGVFHLAFPNTANMRMLVSYRGEEYCYALSGDIRFIVGAKSFDLGPELETAANATAPRHDERLRGGNLAVPPWLGLP